MGKAIPDLRRTAGGAPPPPQLHAVRPGRTGRAGQPELAGYVTRSSRSTARSTTTTHCRTRSTGCAWPTRVCSCRAQPRLYGPGQHGGLRRGAGAIRRPRRGAGRVLDRGQGQDAARQGKVALKRPRRAGCRARSYTGPRPRSAPRSGRGYATTCREASRTRWSEARWSCVRDDPTADALKRLIATNGPAGKTRPSGYGGC